MNVIIENLILLLTKMLPLQNKVVFRSFDGHYSDSPKAVAAELRRTYPDTKIIWLIDKHRMGELPDDIVGIQKDSYRSVYHLNTALAFVDNNYGRKGIGITEGNRRPIIQGILKWLSYRKDQINLSTWHGTPLKRIGNDQPNSEGIDFVSPPLIMTHPNRHTAEVMDRITFGRNINYILGLPRNDILFNAYACTDIKKKLGIPQNTKVVLYAPTFRSDGYDTEDRNVERSGLEQLLEIKVDQLISKLKKKFGGDEWVFIGRFHYFVENEVDWEQLERNYPGQIINGNLNDDMSDYLAVADVLITDYSSCMFDYSLTHRPVLLYLPDLEHYIREERGLYFDPEDLPFPCARSFDQLMGVIEIFDETSYRKGVDELNERLGAVDDGSAAHRVVDLLGRSSYIGKEKRT